MKYRLFSLVSLAAICAIGGCDNDVTSKNDGDSCHSDEACQSRSDGRTKCNVDEEICINPNLGCSDNNACKDRSDGKTECDTKVGECVKPGAECSSDAACSKRDDEKTVCNTSDGVCVKPDEVECNASDDCKSRSDGKTSCDTANHVCVDSKTIECNTNDDCKDRSDKKTSCDTTNHVCVEPKSVECNTSDDCKNRSDGKTSCNTSNHVCYKPDATNSCSSPYTASVGTDASGDTGAGSSYELPNNCTLNTTMGVVELDAKSAGFYNVKVSISNNVAWGNIFSASCNPKDILSKNCSVSGTSDEFPVFMNVGKYYLFVSQTASKDPVGFSVNLTQADEKSLNYCKYNNYKYRIVDFDADASALNSNESIDNSTSGTSIYKVSDKTDDGNSFDSWNNNSSSMSCTLSGAHNGNEKAYLVSFSKTTKLGAALKVSYLDGENTVDGVPSGGGVALYIKKCEGDTYNSIKGMTACADSNTDATVSWEKEFDAGEYLVIVDTSGYKNVNYELTLTKN